MEDSIYKVARSGGYREIGEKYYVDGPSVDPCSHGYDGWYLAPKSRFNTKEEAELVAKFMNNAYKTGELAAQKKIRIALGMKE